LRKGVKKGGRFLGERGGCPVLKEGVRERMITKGFPLKEKLRLSQGMDIYRKTREEKMGRGRKVAIGGDNVSAGIT